MELVSFFIDRVDKIIDMTLEHLIIVIISMVISILIGLTVGILITYNDRIAKVVLNLVGVFMTIPSLALFSLLIPLLGIGKLPAIVGLILYTQLPIVRNVYTGMKNIDPNIIEAARGMGFSERKILLEIKLPLALPVIMTGIRTSVVMGIGIAAIAAYVGAGGLGDYIYQGIKRSNDKMIVIGAIMISATTIVIDRILGIVEKKYYNV